MRLRGRMSVRVRAALGAAAASVLALSLATVWAGDAAYQQWMPNAEAKALREATLLDDAIRPREDRPAEPQHPGAPPWNDWLGRLTEGGYQHRRTPSCWRTAAGPSTTGSTRGSSSTSRR
ncbi:hypothetical protein OU787_13195 [Kitasatospora sp. YST-16]|uniref:hypothetical protein n=1 Tax=unclassified Kitasatospora TaxID=2633591 RepID=UPI0018E33C35|nr:MULTISPECIES: hypothetical protein [unclassified Kitasatospora]WAL72373.1 hypothetical protein OU787_13195 [Kitasatospora sp. YST-16]WNW38421.1 hypothetical protein RKE32_13155 [Streptomyces sp. Li-HN-5-13]